MAQKRRVARDTEAGKLINVARRPGGGAATFLTSDGTVIISEFDTTEPGTKQEETVEEGGDYLA